MGAARLSSRLMCSWAPLESVGRPQTYVGFTQRVDFARNGKKEQGQMQFSRAPKAKKTTRIPRPGLPGDGSQTMCPRVERGGSRVYIQLTRISPEREEVNMHNKRESWLDFAQKGVVW